MSCTVFSKFGGNVTMEREMPTRRPVLSRQRIVDEAVALLEDPTAGELSMRHLARRLGVAPNALYSHVRDREDLISALVDEVYADVDLAPRVSDDWTEQLAVLCRALRQHLLAHPAIVPLALQQAGLGPHGLRLGEAIYSVLRPAGFGDEAVVGTVSSLHTYVLGFVALEAPRGGARDDGNDEFVRRLSSFFAALPPNRFPHHVELAPLLTRVSSDDQFEFGLRTFLAGLVSQLSGIAGSPSPSTVSAGALDDDRSHHPARQRNTRNG
jgi:TetR/AcrR family transcriptional regulator, tetracycline repressor protein